eukprot:TRINITY_DN9162_c0_g2_i5.p2 TRINITY_DN9162_c0_g2~~TRINITY_DN9162_c0_g2_i5.p2  ORF type:complete len:187 (+),score=52.48 TRINITY_DN9162_c0_g2_i5:430-990(+)
MILDRINQAYQTMESQINDLQTQLHSQESQLQQAINERNQRTQSCRQMESQINDLQTQLVTREQEMISQTSDHQQQLQSLQNQIDQLTDQTSSKDDQIHQLEEQLQTVNLDSMDLDDLRQLQTRVNDRIDEIIEEMRDSDTCPVCMENKRNAALHCGHQLCMTCANQVDNCPICRKSKEGVIQLFG